MARKSRRQHIRRSKNGRRKTRNLFRKKNSRKRRTRRMKGGLPVKKGLVGLITLLANEKALAPHLQDRFEGVIDGHGTHVQDNNPLHPIDRGLFPPQQLEGAEVFEDTRPLMTKLTQWYNANYGEDDPNFDL